MKEFDIFSFKNQKTSHLSKTNPNLNKKNKIQSSTTPSKQINRTTNMAHYQYRIDKINQKIKEREQIHSKIINIQKQMESNIRRRHELQQKLLSQSVIERQKKYAEKAVETVKENNIQAKKFAQLQSFHNKQFDYFSPRKPMFNNETTKKIILNSSINREREKVPLNEKQLLHISRVLTFPEFPELQSLLKYTKKLEKYKFYHHHSDILYLLIIAYYHQEEYDKALKNFEQLLKYKKYNPLVFWIAAEIHFKLENYQKCLKLVQIALTNLPQKYFPRLLYLKAFSSVQTFNYTDGIICYNQLISICPRVPEYYLQRAILYERTRYYDYARQDFQEYRKLKPKWQNELKQKILLQKNVRKQQNLKFTLKSLHNY